MDCSGLATTAFSSVWHSRLLVGRPSDSKWLRALRSARRDGAWRSCLVSASLRGDAISVGFVSHRRSLEEEGTCTQWR